MKTFRETAIGKNFQVHYKKIRSFSYAVKERDLNLLNVQRIYLCRVNSPVHVGAKVFFVIVICDSTMI